MGQAEGPWWQHGGLAGTGDGDGGLTQGSVVQGGEVHPHPTAPGSFPGRGRSLALWDHGGGVWPFLCRCGYSDRPTLVPLIPQGIGSET